MLKLIGMALVAFLVLGLIIAAVKEGGVGTLFALGIGVLILFAVGIFIHPAAAVLLFAIVVCAAEG